MGLIESDKISKTLQEGTFLDEHSLHNFRPLFQIRGHYELDHFFQSTRHSNSVLQLSMDCLNSLNEVKCFNAKVFGIMRISENSKSSFKGTKFRILKPKNSEVI